MMLSILSILIFTFAKGVLWTWIAVSHVNSFEERQAHDNWRGAFYKNKGKDKCSKCDLYLCICQSGLFEFGFESVKPLKDPSMNQKIANCPHRCVNAGLECISCYEYDKFKGMVIEK